MNRRWHFTRRGFLKKAAGVAAFPYIAPSSALGKAVTFAVRERIIVLDYKIRAKTMQGSKNDDKVLGHCYLSEYLRGANGICDLQEVV